MDRGATDITWHQHSVGSHQRQAQKGQQAALVWFTGLSGSGKSTVANATDQALFARGRHSYLLDGDNVRHGLNASPEMLQPRGPEYAQRFGLGFAAVDRQENLRRIGEVSKLMCDAGLIVLAAFVSPYQEDRSRLRDTLGKDRFIEVFVDAPLSVCEERDPKGLYKKARAGQIAHFTGISDPYEAPTSPELHLTSDGTQAPRKLAEQVVDYLDKRGLLSPGPT